MTALKIVAIVVIGYLFGNFNTAVVISKLKGRDIRTLGSGNPGTMNMLRNICLPGLSVPNANFNEICM